jgi:hypothetical protein
MSVDRDLTSARAIIRRLLERETHGDSDAGTGAAMMQRAAERVFDDLKGAVGTDGLDALLGRAISRTEREHPAVTTMRRADDVCPLNVAAAVEAHGVDAARAALEAVLAALVDILAALIGADMTRSLLHDQES